MKSLIIRNCSKALIQNDPEDLEDLYVGQDLTSQVIDILDKYSTTVPFGISKWLEDILVDLELKNEIHIAKKLTDKILKGIMREIKNIPFLIMSEDHFSKIQYFMKTPKLAKLFILYNYPNNSSGKSYMDTLIGKQIKATKARNKFFQSKIGS